MKSPLCLAPLLVCVAACHVHDRSETRWIGPLTARPPSPKCPTTKGVLILRDDKITFAPDEGTWVLSGAANPKTMTATRSRPTSDHKIYKTDLQAEWTETAVMGTYNTPDCAYRVELTRF